MRRSRQLEDEKINESWLIPYADILTLMLALFVILFASSQIDQSKFEQISQSLNQVLTGGSGLLDNTSLLPDPNIQHIANELDPFEKEETEEERRFRLETELLKQLQQQIDAYIEDNALTTQLRTHLNYEELIVEIQDRALFDSGSAHVKGNAKQIATAMAEMLAQYPGYEIVISGHTDNRPINTAQFPSNWELSTARALNFMKALLENPDLDPKYFRAVGYGEYRPVADNSTAEGRAQNRRVEVSILRKFPQQPGAGL